MPLATYALTRVHEVREILGITDLSEDRTIERLINGVSYSFASVAGRAFEYNAAAVEDLRGNGGTRLLLRRTPIASITSIATIADDGTSNTAESSSSYRLDNSAAGSIFRRTGWMSSHNRAYGVMENPLYGGEENYWRVTYAGGYITPYQASSVYPGGSLGTATLPGDIEDAVIDEVVTRFHQKGRNLWAAEERLGDEMIKWRSDVAAVNQQARIDLLPTTVAVANRYRPGHLW